MSILYIITNTSGDDIFSIMPGALNGPGGTHTDTDLMLYGSGATNHGEGFNENFIKLAENFACPQKESGDFLPGTDTELGFVPGTGSYVSGTHETMPKDKNDLGPNNGINNPLPGQLWFNSTIKKIMVFDGIAGSFISTGGTTFDTTEPTSPQDGDMWYDTSDPNNPQLKIYDSTHYASPGFLSVSDRYVLHDGTQAMTGNLNLDGTYKIINSIDPVSPQDGATKNYVDDAMKSIAGGSYAPVYPSDGFALDGRYLNVSGDAMAGDLNVTGYKIIFSTMELNTGLGNETVGADISMAGNGLIVADDNVYINIDGTANATGSLIISKGDAVVGGTETALFTVDNAGRLSSNNATYETLVTTDDSIPNKKYVDDQIASATSGLGGTVPEIFSGVGPFTGKDGDIWINGTVISIKAASVWRQIYPAQYS